MFIRYICMYLGYTSEHKQKIRAKNITFKNEASQDWLATLAYAHMYAKLSTSIYLLSFGRSKWTKSSLPSFCAASVALAIGFRYRRGLPLRCGRAVEFSGGVAGSPQIFRPPRPPPLRSPPGYLGCK